MPAPLIIRPTATRLRNGSAARLGGWHSLVRAPLLKG